MILPSISSSMLTSWPVRSIECGLEIDSNLILSIPKKQFADQIISLKSSSDSSYNRGKMISSRSENVLEGLCDLNKDVAETVGVLKSNSLPVSLYLSSSCIDHQHGSRGRSCETLGGEAGGGVYGGKGDNGSYGISGLGFSDSNSGKDNRDLYYQKIIEKNPGNSLLMNYAKFLKEVCGDLDKSQEYCARAILENPSDGETLSLYARLIRATENDASAAENYYKQAIEASSSDCCIYSFVMASYTRFLWDAEEEQEQEYAEEK